MFLIDRFPSVGVPASLDAERHHVVIDSGSAIAYQAMAGSA
jgi:hypothetical protein